MEPEVREIATLGSLREVRAAAEARLLGLEPHSCTPIFHCEERCEGVGGGDVFGLLKAGCVCQKHSRG